MRSAARLVKIDEPWESGLIREAMVSVLQAGKAEEVAGRNRSQT